MPVYFVQAGDDGPVKIGHAADPFVRLKNLQSGSPIPLRLLGIAPGGEVQEREIHRQFARLRVRGEWFAYADEMRDCFAPITRPHLANDRKRSRSALDAYLADRGITRMKFAEDIGVSPSVITDLCSGKIFLSRTVARAIERQTAGEVTANDFVHLGASPEPSSSAEAAN